MTERSIIEAAGRLRRTGEPYLVASVVCADNPGARMLLTRFRWVAGAASGGCLDGDLSRRAWWRTRDGSALVLSYEPGAAEEEHELRAAFGLDGACGVDVLIERAGIPGRIDALEVAERCQREQRRGAVATIVRATTPGIRVGARVALLAGAAAVEEEADRLAPELRDELAADMRAAIESGRPALHTRGAVDVLVEAIIPPPRLFLFGTGHDTVPIASLAKVVGWDVVVCAHEQRHATRDRFALADDVIVVECPDDVAPRIAESERAVAVVAHHDRERDAACIASLLPTAVRYIGTLGPVEGIPDPRIHAAAGASPAERALALIADIQAALNGPASRKRAFERPSQQLAAVS